MSTPAASAIILGRDGGLVDDATVPYEVQELLAANDAPANDWLTAVTGSPVAVAEHVRAYGGSSLRRRGPRRGCT